MTDVLMSKKQKLMLRFQCKNRLDSESSSGGSDVPEEINAPLVYHDQDYHVKQLFRNKVERALENLEGVELTTID